MSGLTVAATDDKLFDVLGAFVVNITPLADAAVIQGQGNRVAEPAADDFVIMVPLRRERLETNVDTYQDDAWLGSVAAGVLTVTEILNGAVRQGAKPSANVSLGANTIVGTQISGSDPGGVGTYNITPSQTVAGDTIFQAGAGFYLQPTKITIQIEVHGPNSADNAQIISTMLRDEYAVDFFAGFGASNGFGNTITPCYADDPRQMPFSNEEQQVENRWVIECVLQGNFTVRAPQQFADEIIIGLKNVDVEYPPTNDAIGDFIIGESHIG